MADGYDITLDGNQYRLVRTVEGTRPYRKSWRRQLVQQQLIGDNAQQSRTDQAAFYQTDWSGGSRWELPRYTSELDSVFETSNNLNSHYKPGFLKPENQLNATVNSNLIAAGPLIQYNKKLLAIGSTKNVDATNVDIYQWTPGSDAFVQQAYTSGHTGAKVWAAAADPRNNRVFFLAGSTMTCYAFDPVTPASGSSILATGLTGRPGSNIFVHNDRLLVWDTNKLYEITDPLGTPALSAAIASDGLGPDLLNQLDTASSQPIAFDTTLRTAIPTPDGIFYVKNVLTEGQPQPWVFRIDRDESGTDISSPIATLPAGNLALSAGFLLGALIISTTPDWAKFLENDSQTEGHVRCDFYHYTSFNGLNGLGRPLGEQPTESPFMVLGSEGDELFIGGSIRIWAYSAARGGIHPVYADLATPDTGPFRAMGRSFDSSGNGIKMFWGGQKRYVIPADEDANDPDTVTNFGDDIQHYRLDSAYFDFGLPGESKTLSSVKIETETLGADQQWSVYISVDDGAWTSIATLSSATSGETDLTASSLTGERFRYRVVYQTKSAARQALRGLTFKAEVGAMVPVWDLIINGDEILNVENQLLDPETIYDNLETTAQKTTPVTLIDNFRSERVSDTSTHTVKILSLEFFKQYDGESEIHLSLVGAGTEDGGA